MGRGAGGQVPAPPEKADDRQLVRVQGPVVGMAADSQRGGGLVILKRVGPGGPVRRWRSAAQKAWNPACR